MAAEDVFVRALGAYFRGRTMLVTGASSGIGYDAALVLSRLGVKTALLARRQKLLEQLASRIREEGGHALVLAADVTRQNEVSDAVALALNQFGQLDILINSAGVLEPGPVESMEPQALRRMLEVNLLGTLHMIQAVLPSMREARSGNIVNIASLSGRRGVPPLGGYSATKFAVVGLTEALRVELYGSGVRVSLVMPGVVDTALIRSESGEHLGLSGIVPAMPVRWATWAVLAAVMLGLAEVDVPPGAVVAEKLTALFPGITDAALALGARLFSWAADRTERGKRSQD